MRMDYLNKLNDKQREAALYTEGPLLILAGAGSGKTATMTHRIAHLIRDNGVSPYNILAVTFTNKAAGEMRDRVEGILGGSVNMWIMTFHAACLRILRRHADILGYTNSFIVYDPVDTKAVVKKILKDRAIDEKKFPVGSLLGAISHAKEAEIGPDRYKNEYGGGYREEIIAGVYSEYQKTLKDNNAMDFDDLLWNAVKVFDRDEAILLEYQNRFRYIMVDEYQDTNKTQYKFVKMLAEGSGNICVVGDDDQCIYQWRGADISNILDFEKDFPGAKVIKLEQNYRSTGNILAAAHSVIENNTHRKSKKLWTDADDGSKIVYHRADNEKEEAYYVAQEINRLCTTDRKWNDFAVLYRTNAQSRNFEEALSARDIPYRVVGGVRYYDRKEIKDIVAYMRLVMNPADDLAMMRIINEPKRGIGGTTQAKIAKTAEVMGTSVFETLCDADIRNSLSAKASQMTAEMIETLQHYHDEMDNLRVSDIYDGLLNGTGYLKALEEKDNVEADGRIENLLEFKSVIYDYEEEGELTLSDFLERIALLSDIDNHDENENAVTLMTMHSAKGLEFPMVFMPGMEDGLFPSMRDNTEQEMEEERRLCYVGMTRAKERLCLTSAELRMLYGKTNYTRESQFLRELDPHLIDGDGIYVKKKEVELGSSVPFDGYAREIPAKPFNAFSAAKKEVHAKEKRRPIRLAAGDIVEHGKFGRGMVVKIDKGIVEVMFDTAGKKKLAVDVAPLTKVE